MGTKAVPRHFNFPFPLTHSTLSVTHVRTSSNLFAKKNCYLFCITVTCIACIQACFALSFVFLFAHFSIRCCNQRHNEFFLPGKGMPIWAVATQPPSHRVTILMRMDCPKFSTTISTGAHNHTQPPQYFTEPVPASTSASNINCLCLRLRPFPSLLSSQSPCLSLPTSRWPLSIRRAAL